MSDRRRELTKGYRLPARYVIHTVGPVWHGRRNGEAGLLPFCYRRSIELPAENRIASMAFPSISTGIYGYPIDEAASIAVAKVRRCVAEFHRDTRSDLLLLLPRRLGSV
jgi:O-acetyl-ADP-ribose deacetylase (regulator of RNase III)